MFNAHKVALAVLAPVLLAGCQGLHRSGNLTTAHAESLHILGLQIPGSAHDKLEAMTPKPAELISVTAVPEDLDSVVGFVNRLWGFGYATATWKESK